MSPSDTGPRRLPRRNDTPDGTCPRDGARFLRPASLLAAAWLVAAAPAVAHTGLASARQDPAPAPDGSPPVASASVQDASPPAPSGPRPPAPAGAIAGTVTTPIEGAVPAGTEVELVELRRRVTVGADGAFRFEDVPVGSYLVRAEGPLGRGVARTRVVEDETATVALRIDLAFADEVVVSASADPRRQLEVAQPTSVLAGDELDARLEGTLGATLDEQPGVSSTYFGPGASRPVIRGLGGERVRTLEGGIGSADASAASPDHAVSVDPLSAERIEIVRGPATLLYGSSAVGGVVNVLDGRIPDHVPAEVNGRVELLGGTVSEERSGAVSVTGGSGRIAWHADYLRRETDDHEIPGFAESRRLREEERGEDEGEGEEEAFGVLENSALDNESGAVGLSWVTDRGFLGVSYRGFDTFYGVPGHAHGEGDEPEDEGHGEAPVRIDLEQRRVDLEGELRRDFGLFRGAKLRFGSADYEHAELEGDEVGTRFLNDSWEGRFELVQRRWRSLSGSVGLQVSRSDFSALGGEAFVPPSVTDSAALFVFEELAAGDELTWQLGLRYETQDVEPAGGLPARSFDGVSASAGLVWTFAPDLSLTASVSRSERLPTATELYADGPHAATRAFEIGDPDLATEESLGVDLALKAGGERASGSLNLFVNSFDGYVYEEPTGDLEDGLAVVRFVQRDAEFVGGELDAVVRVADFGAGHLDLTARADVVRAELDDGTPLPRIPPLRYGLGLSFHRGPWRAALEGRRLAEQDRTAPNERPTDGHTLLNGSASYRIVHGDLVSEIVLRGTNLTDEEARNHVSFLKDLVPLPGRDLSLILRLSF